MATSPRDESPVEDEERVLEAEAEDGAFGDEDADEAEAGEDGEDVDEGEDNLQVEEDDDPEEGEEDHGDHEDDGSEEEGPAGGSFQSADDEDDDFDLPQDLAHGAGVGAGDGDQDFQQHASSSSGALPPGLNDDDGGGTERWNLRKDGNKEELEKIFARLSTDHEHTKISKMFSYVLRHAAHKLGVTIRKDGFVRLREIMKLRNFKPYTLEELMAAVYFDAKERYTMVREFDGELLIRANQGHTMKVVEDDLLLELITDPAEVQECVHGTYLVHWPFIKRQGISKVARNHIHLANKLPEDGKIRGMRNTAELFIYVDVPLAMEDGLTFYRSKNDVILTQGFDGWLPVKYFQKAVRIDYNTCDIEEMEFDADNAPVPQWAAELAPIGPDQQGTYLIKNLEALISNCRKRLQDINELKALQEKGEQLDDDELERLGKHAQVYTELQSLEQRFRQHKGNRRETPQEKENRAKEAMEATTLVKRKDRALTPPWDKGKSHLESVGMKSTEKEKAEWAALGRRRDNATPTAAPKKEDQWSVLGRGRQGGGATSTPSVAKRDDSTKRGGKAAKATQPKEEDNWRSARAEPKKEGKQSSKAADEASSKGAGGGPPRFFNSKKSSDALSWRDKMTMPRKEDRSVTPEPAPEDSLSWRSQMVQPRDGPPQQPPRQQPPTPSWREQMQQPVQQQRTDGQMRQDRMPPPPLGDFGPQRDDFPPAIPPPPSTPAPMTMPPMMPNPAVANAPLTPAGGGTPGMMPMQSQVRGFGPSGPCEGGMPQMMQNPLVGTMPPQGGNVQSMMSPSGPPTPPGTMQGMMPQTPPSSRGGGPGMQGAMQGAGGMQGGPGAQGGPGMQGGGGGMQGGLGMPDRGSMQAVGAMQPGPGMQSAGGMQQAGMGRFMAVPMWQGQQMQGGQVCAYSPSGQGQPQLFCTPGTGGQGQQGGANFGTPAPGQSPGGSGGNWMRQAPQFMQQQGHFDPGGQSMMQQPGSPQAGMGMQASNAGGMGACRGGPCGDGPGQGMQQAMPGANFSQGFVGGSDQRGPQQGPGPCCGYGGNQQTPRPDMAFDGRPGPPQQQAFGYGGNFAAGGGSPSGKGGDNGQGMRSPAGQAGFGGGVNTMGGGYGYGGQQQPQYQGGDGRMPMQQMGPRGGGFQDQGHGKGGGWTSQGYDDDGRYGAQPQGMHGGHGAGRRGDGQWQQEEAWGYGDYDGGDGYDDYDMGEDMRGQWRKGGGGGGGRGKDAGGKGGKKGGKGGGGAGKGGGGKAAGKASRDREDAQDWAALGRRRAAA